MNIESRVGRIDRIGRWLHSFFNLDMIQSGLKIIDLQIALAGFVSREKLAELYLELINHAEYEFKNKRKSYQGFHPHRTECFDLMYPKILALQSNHGLLLQKWMASEEVLKTVTQRINAQKIWNNILKIIKEKEKPNIEEKIIELNLLYLSIYEGFFEQDVRICYSFLEMSKGNITDMREMDKMGLKQIRKKFEENGEKPILFEGRNNRLRNSIAHFSFEYDEDSKTMRYTDDFLFKRDQEPEPWIKEYSQSEIFWFNQKIVNVHELVTTMFGLLVIRDACFADETWK